MRSHDQPLDFDLELAKSRSNDNPVYYLQYAHARVASVMKQLAARGLGYDAAKALASSSGSTARTSGRAARRWRAIRKLLAQAASARAPHALVHFLRELAQRLSHLVQRRHVHRRGRRASATPASPSRWARSRCCATGWRCSGASAPESM